MQAHNDCYQLRHLPLSCKQLPTAPRYKNENILAGVSSWTPTAFFFFCAPLRSLWLSARPWTDFRPINEPLTSLILARLSSQRQVITYAAASSPFFPLTPRVDRATAPLPSLSTLTVNPNTCKHCFLCQPHGSHVSARCFWFTGESVRWPLPWGFPLKRDRIWKRFHAI